MRAGASVSPVSRLSSRTWLFRVWGVELDRLRNKIDSSSLNVRRLIQTLSSQNKL